MPAAHPSAPRLVIAARGTDRHSQRAFGPSPCPQAEPYHLDSLPRNAFLPMAVAGTLIS